MCLCVFECVVRCFTDGRLHFHKRLRWCKTVYEVAEPAWALKVLTAVCLSKTPNRWTFGCLTEPLVCASCQLVNLSNRGRGVGRSLLSRRRTSERDRIECWSTVIPFGKSLNTATQYLSILDQSLLHHAYHLISKHWLVMFMTSCMTCTVYWGKRNVML